MFTVLETLNQGLRLLFCNLLDIFALVTPKMELKWPTVVHALRKWLASFAVRDVILAAVVIFRCGGYKYCCRGQFANVIHGNAGTFSEQVIASIIYDCVG